MPLGGGGPDYLGQLAVSRGRTARASTRRFRGGPDSVRHPQKCTERPESVRHQWLRCLTESGLPRFTRISFAKTPRGAVE
jgi:hypothetical protein